MSFESWIVFVGIWILAGIPLGPNALNCISTSASKGFNKSLLCIVGILLAAVLFIVVVSSGLSVVLLANAKIFNLIKILGAIYLIWMGIKLWKNNASELEIETVKPVSDLGIVASKN